MEKNKNNLRQIEGEEAAANILQEQSTKEVDINRYQDREGLSVAALDLGLWYVESRQKIIEVIYFLFLIIGIVFWLYFFYEYGLYVTKGIVSEKQIIKEILTENLPTYDFYSSTKAKNLVLFPSRVILGTENKRDIIGQVKNLNSNYWARFDYYFLNNGEKIVEKKGFVLPGETKQILELGRDIPESVGGLSMVLENVRWGRINPHNFGNWEDFKKDHLNVVFSNISFAPSETSSLSEKVPLNTLSFILENKTNFNYWNVPLVISLYYFSDLGAIATYDVNDFKSSESRSVNITWPGHLSKVTNIIIEPALDITRFDIYKDFKAPIGTFR